MKKKIGALVLLSLLGTATLKAENIKCGLSYDLMEVIAKVEGTSKREVGYPYIISFNNPIDYKEVLKGKDFKYINSRTLDCKNLSNCVNILKTLENKKIRNLDLGAFQMNYIYHKFDRKEYFILERSYERACSFLESLIAKHGYSWETVARYHSATPAHNLKYRKKISKVLLANK